MSKEGFKRKSLPEEGEMISVGGAGGAGGGGGVPGDTPAGPLEACSIAGNKGKICSSEAVKGPLKMCVCVSLPFLLFVLVSLIISSFFIVSCLILPSFLSFMIIFLSSLSLLLQPSRETMLTAPANSISFEVLDCSRFRGDGRVAQDERGEGRGAR